MLKSIEMTGSTRDEAIQKALDFLGLDRDDVSVEVLSNGKKGFLGFGGADARVKVVYEVPDDEPKVQNLQLSLENEKLIEQTQTNKDETQKIDLEVKKVENTESEKEKNNQTEQPNKNLKNTYETRHSFKTKEREPIVPYITPVPMKDELISDNARQAVKFIDGLLEKLNIEGKATVLDISEPSHIKIDIAGKNMGHIIGRRGDTLDAIQYLTGLVLNQNSEEHLRLTVDTENYRAKRAESLERLARKMALKVCKYHKAMTLEPMNPYERRIIHASLQNFRGVTTYSTGTEPARRVVISPENTVRLPKRGFQPRDKK